MSDSAMRCVAVTRRPATAADVPLLRELFADSRMELTALPPDTRWILADMQFRAERRQHAAQFPHAQHEIIAVDGVDVGRLLIDVSADAVRIVDVTVGLGRRGEGIACSALAGVVDDAVAAGRRVWLTAWSGNAPAIRLCERLGLSVVADEGGYLTLERPPAVRSRGAAAASTARRPRRHV